MALIEVEPFRPEMTCEASRVLANAFASNPDHVAAFGAAALAKNEAFLYCPRVLGQWFDGIRFYAAASSPRRSRRTWAGLR